MPPKLRITDRAGFKRWLHHEDRIPQAVRMKHGNVVISAFVNAGLDVIEEHGLQEGKATKALDIGGDVKYVAQLSRHKGGSRHYTLSLHTKKRKGGLAGALHKIVIADLEELPWVEKVSS